MSLIYSESNLKNFLGSASNDPEFAELIDIGGIDAPIEHPPLPAPDYSDTQFSGMEKIISEIVAQTEEDDTSPLFEGKSPFDVKMIGKKKDKVALVNYEDGSLWILNWATMHFEIVKKQMPTAR